MAGFGGMRKGRREAVENLGFSEEGDCPRCGGESEPSTMTGYLRCLKCSHEWADPEYVEEKKEMEIPTYQRDAELIEQFKKDVESGSLANVLGVKKDLSEEQEESLGRLEEKWMSGMQGRFNTAREERKPLMINFDDDDNIVSTEVGALTNVSNGFDGEGLVIEGSQAWISSEGRRSPERQAKIIRIDLASGRQQEELPLPLDWRARPGKGLGSNQGPESLTMLGPGDLILATEKPLLQNGPNGGISLARRRPGEELRSAGTLDPGIGGRYEGLTELQGLPQSQQLLGLRRGYKPLNHWTAQLQLFAIPDPQSPPLKPIIGWDLLGLGLPADNWEAMTVGPQLSDGRQTLVLGSDNNFNPWQASWIAVLTPRRTADCAD